MKIRDRHIKAAELPKRSMEYMRALMAELEAGKRHDKRSTEKMAGDFGITIKNHVKELTELAIVNYTRELVRRYKKFPQQTFRNLVMVYDNQVNLSHRTSESILLQQYSTPCPITYLAGLFTLATWGVSVFEPSAGNGLFTIAAEPENVVVNEIDPVRHYNLTTQGFKQVLQQDAFEPFEGFEKKFYAVHTNPPFGSLETKIKFGTFPLSSLEHVMALRALECMADHGRAAIIIGGHTKWDRHGRVQEGKNRIFLNYLYHHYHVIDVINISGKKLYARQGTAYDTRLILINGRKKTPEGNAPVRNPQWDYVIKDFNELAQRIIVDLSDANETIYNRFKNLSMEGDEHHIVFLQLENQLITFGQAAQQVQKIADESFQFTYCDFPNQFLGVPVFCIPIQKKEEYFSKLKANGFNISEHYAYGSLLSAEQLKSKAKRLKNKSSEEDLGAPYRPASDSCVVLDTHTPDSMFYEMSQALAKIKQELGGDVDNFVRHRLGYSSKEELCKVLSAEQIDAVAVAIYNIEAYDEGMIIGDQTGIGKGRVAAAMIRYSVKQGKKPVFLTEKANLFSDIYRDLAAIGSANLKPFIINSRDTKTDIKDEDGEVIYEALNPTKQAAIFEKGKIPSEFDFAIATYSQFNSPQKKPQKPWFLHKIAQGNILILDEAHNSSGSSQTGEFMQSVVRSAKGVVFLSATFAKQPSNMPIYALKTCISEANMSKDSLIHAIRRGGVALQEILSSQLVAEGQMIRRERSYEGIG